MDLSHLLNPEQLAAVEHIEGPLLVLAGAGSGKTRIVTFRIARLIERGVAPWNILALTFTNKAAAEMHHRVQKLVSERVSICTFHSLGARLLRQEIQALGYKPDFTIYDEDDTDKLLRAVLKQLDINEKEAPLKDLRGLISKAKNNLTPPDEVAGSRASAVAQCFPKVYALYQAKLKEYNSLDFDDLLFLTVRLFREVPELLEKYRRQWPYILIDEYQDTNPSQYLIAKLLAGDKCNLFVVGDPDQSIYSWRGADIHNIMNFERDFIGARVVRLEQNYRSRSNILEAANALIRNNAVRYEKNLWSTLGPGKPITLYIAGDEQSEAAYVVERLLRHRDEERVPLSDMVIFYRTNFQSRSFEDALLRRRVPYIIVGGVSFYQRREVKDILAILRMVYSGSDAVSFLRTVNTPKRGLGATTLDKILQGAEAARQPLFDFCADLCAGVITGPRLTAKQATALSSYLSFLRQLRQIQQADSLQELVRAAIETSGYIEHLREEPETFEDRKANIIDLIAKAAEWEKEGDEERSGKDLGLFLEELSLKSSADDSDLSQERVNLMTLHNGKGLEFPVAFLVGMEEELFPHANSRNSPSGVEEERRLCYVGMTRAKEQLHLSAAQYRFLWGHPRTMLPSRFLREIPKEYLHRVFSARDSGQRLTP